MELAAAIGMGIGAMCCAMLRLPLTSVLLATLLMGTDGLTVIPEVIVAVVVSFVVTLGRRTPGPAAGSRDGRTCGTASPRGAKPARMTVRPAPPQRDAIAWLFMVGSACFVLGSVPAYLNAVGGWVDGVTYFVGSLFFTRPRRPARPGAEPRR